MVYEEPVRFDPPEEGLQPDESITWERKAGIPFLTTFCGGCLTLSSIFLIVFVGAFFGDTFRSCQAKCVNQTDPCQGTRAQVQR